MGVLGEHTSAGARVALVAGGGLGLLLGVLLVRLENSDLVLAGAGERAQAVLLLVALGAVGSTLLLLPVECLVVALIALRPRLSTTIRPLRLYASVWLATGLCAGAFLWTGFNVVRDLATPRGALVTGGLALGWAGSVCCANLWLPARSAAPASRRRDLSVLGCVLAALSAAGVWSYRALADRTAPAARGPAHTGAAAGAGATTVRPRHPVILVSIDTLRADHLSCYGYARATTPEIDALARDGALFARAHSQAPWTLPAHATLLTGLYPSSHGARSWDNSRFLGSQRCDVLADWNVTLAEMLSGAGYRTAAFTSVTWLQPRFGMAQGFDTFELDLQARAGALVTRAIEWLESDADAPPFLFLHFFDVHEYTSPPEYDGLFRDAGYRGRLLDGPLLLTGNQYDDLSEADLAYARGRYDGALRYVDAELGRLFARLRERGLYDEALIVVTADHGEEFWEHGGTGHGFTLYAEQLRVPLVIKPPALERPRVAAPAGAAGVIDVVPTVRDYVGLPPLAFLEGLSLRPALAGAELAPRTLFAESTYFENGRAALSGGYKYIANDVPPLALFDARQWQKSLRAFFKFRGAELYEAALDPGEVTNRIDARPGVAADLHAELRAFLRRERAHPGGVADLRLDEATLDELGDLGYGR